MKISINDEYSNLGEEFNIILDEYANKQESRPDDMDDAVEKDTECCNVTYSESEDNEFKVDLQYSEESSYTPDKSKYNDYEKYFDCSYEKKYVEECEECADHRIIDSLGKCPEEIIQENGYGAANQECNQNYSKDCGNNYKSCEDKYDSCENNYKNCEDIYNNCEETYKESGYDYGNGYQAKPNCRKGRIEVLVKLDDKNGIEIKGAKINLYELNGVCPKLYESKLTDCNGKAIFEDLENGCYRVISLVDRRYFEKPTYITWNEVTIDDCVKDACICVVNKIKPSCCRR